MFKHESQDSNQATAFSRPITLSYPPLPAPLNRATRLEFSVIKGGIQYQRQLTTNPIIHTKSLSPSASEADTFSCNGWRTRLFRDAISASDKRSNSVNHVRLTEYQNVS